MKGQCGDSDSISGSPYSDSEGNLPKIPLKLYVANFSRRELHGALKYFVGV